MLIKLAKFSVKHRRLMVGFWVILLVALGAISSSVDTNFATEFELPSSESNDVQNLLKAS